MARTGRPRSTAPVCANGHPRVNLRRVRTRRWSRRLHRFTAYTVLECRACYNERNKLQYWKRRGRVDEYLARNP